MIKESDKRLLVTQYLERCTFCIYENCATNISVRDNKQTLENVTISCIRVKLKEDNR